MEKNNAVLFGGKQVIDYAEKNEVKEEVLKAAGAAVGKKIELDRKEGDTMCTFFDELERECRLEGKREGRREGMMQKAVQVVKNLMQKQKLSLEDACELAEISVENYRKYANA